MKKFRMVFCLVLVFALSVGSSVALAADCKKPSKCYMTFNFTGTRHNVVLSKFTGIATHSGKTVLNNEVTGSVSAYQLTRATNADGKWRAATASMSTDTSTSKGTTAYCDPILYYLTKGKATCKIKCFYCNQTASPGTGEISTSKKTSGLEFTVTL